MKTPFAKTTRGLSVPHGSSSGHSDPHSAVRPLHTAHYGRLRIAWALSSPPSGIATCGHSVPHRAVGKHRPNKIITLGRHLQCRGVGSTDLVLQGGSTDLVPPRGGVDEPASWLTHRIDGPVNKHTSLHLPLHTTRSPPKKDRHALLASVSYANFVAWV